MAHRPAQLVALPGGVPGGGDGHLDALLLPEEDAVGLAQGRLQLRGGVADRLPPLPAAHDVLAGPGRPRAGADGAHGDGHLGQVPGAQAGEEGLLGPALHLEQPHRIGPAQDVEGPRVVAEAVQAQALPRALPDVLEAAPDEGEHPQPQEVHLDQVDLELLGQEGQVVLVPGEDGASGHPRRLDGGHLQQGLVRDDHAPHVDGVVAGAVQELAGEVEQELGQAPADAPVVLRPPPRRPAPRRGAAPGRLRGPQRAGASRPRPGRSCAPGPGGAPGPGRLP